jgi:hypothetical protein
LDKTILISEQSGSTPNRKFFETDLSKLSKNDSYHGEIILNVLYYPTFQNINIKINGIPINPPLSTLWHKTEKIDYFSALQYTGFHALRISGLPKNGILTVDVKFRGSTLGN